MAPWSLDPCLESHTICIENTLVWRMQCAKEEISKKKRGPIGYMGILL